MYFISATCFAITLRHHQALQIVQTVKEIHTNCHIAIAISMYNV